MNMVIIITPLHLEKNGRIASGFLNVTCYLVYIVINTGEQVLHLTFNQYNKLGIKHSLQMLRCDRACISFLRISSKIYDCFRIYPPILAGRS